MNDDGSSKADSSPSDLDTPIHNKTLMERFNWFCFDDLPPLDGRLRCFFYVSVFLAGAWEIVLLTPDRIRSFPAVLYEPPGVMQFIAPLIGSTPESVGALMAALSIPLAILWLFSALGLGGRLPMIGVGVLFFLFLGAFKGCTGTGHTWYVPMYCLLALGLLSAPDRIWSVDAVLARRYSGYWFCPAQRGLVTTGLARKLALIAAIFTLFSGGVTKLYVSGFQWMDGLTLHAYLERIGDPKGSIGRFFYALLLDHPMIVTWMSILTILFEIGSLFAICSRRLRPWIIGSAWVFHAVIALLMLPVYIPQMLCYTLGMDWGAVYRRCKRASVTQAATSNASCRLNKASMRRGWTVMAVVSGVLIATVIVQREWFPLTHVPMYSTYLAPGRIGPHRISDFEDVDKRREIARQFRATASPNTMKFWIARNSSLVIRMDNGDEHPIDKPFDLISPRWKKYSVFERIGRYSLYSFAGDENAEAHLQRIIAEVLLDEVVRPWLASENKQGAIHSVELVLMIDSPQTITKLEVLP